MADAADLYAAITANPADDLPRLVLADWLEDCGESDYAQFIRDQIRLTQVPEWDPLAIRSRYQLRETLTFGKPFVAKLPELPPFMKWHPEQPFRRGFGASVVVNQLSGLLESGAELFDMAPIDELWLSAATLDQWRAFAKSPWLRNVRKLHFHFSQGLYEPIRCLAEPHYSDNIDEIWFDTLATPAADTVIEALAESKLARQLTGLHMRLVHVPSLPEIIETLAKSTFTKLERLTMKQAGLDHSQFLTLNRIPLMKNLQRLDLSENLLDIPSLYKLMYLPKLSSLTYDSNADTFVSYSENGDFLQLLNKLNNNEADRSGHLKSFSFLRTHSRNINQLMKVILHCINQCHCFNFTNSVINEEDLKKLLTSETWPHLRELNLSEITFDDESIEEICKRSDPENVSVIQFSRHCLSERSAERLESHFGDSLVWAAEDAATGLARARG